MRITTDNIEFSSNTKIIEEIKKLKKENIPDSIIEVLVYILLDRKNELELSIKSIEDYFVKNNSNINLIIDNYKYYKKEIDYIDKFLSEYKLINF